MTDGIELGKAYVQIVPSAQGIKSALTAASLRASPKNQGYTENRGCTSCF